MLRGISILTLSLTACGAAPSQSHEAVLAPEIAANVSSIALAPTTLPDGLEADESSVARLDSLLVDAVEQAGFAIVAPEVYTAEWRRAVESVGGVFDPYTGRRLEERFEEARQQLFTALNGEYGAEAVLYPAIEIVMAPFEGRTAEWDGVSQAIPGRGSALGALIEAVFTPDDVEVGEVAATTLTVFMESTEGQHLLDHRAGIEVLDRWHQGAWEPLDTTLVDDERLRRAVSLVLEPLHSLVR